MTNSCQKKKTIVLIFVFIIHVAESPQNPRGGGSAPRVRGKAPPGADVARQCPQGPNVTAEQQRGWGGLQSPPPPNSSPPPPRQGLEGSPEEGEGQGSMLRRLGSDCPPLRSRRGGWRDPPPKQSDGRYLARVLAFTRRRNLSAHSGP